MVKGSIPSQGTCLGYSFDSWLKHVREAASQWFSPTSINISLGGDIYIGWCCASCWMTDRIRNTTFLSLDIHRSLILEFKKIHLQYHLNTHNQVSLIWSIPPLLLEFGVLVSVSLHLSSDHLIILKHYPLSIPFAIMDGKWKSLILVLWNIKQTIKIVPQFFLLEKWCNEKTEGQQFFFYIASSF